MFVVGERVPGHYYLLISGAARPSSTLRANPYPEVTDRVCRLPLPTLVYRLEAVHRGDLLRRSVRANQRVGCKAGVEQIAAGGLIELPTGPRGKGLRRQLSLDTSSDRSFDLPRGALGWLRTVRTKYRLKRNIGFSSDVTKHRPAKTTTRIHPQCRLGSYEGKETFDETPRLTLRSPRPPFQGPSTTHETPQETTTLFGGLKFACTFRTLSPVEMVPGPGRQPYEEKRDSFPGRRRLRWLCLPLPGAHGENAELPQGDASRTSQVSQCPKFGSGILTGFPFAHGGRP